LVIVVGPPSRTDYEGPLPDLTDYVSNVLRRPSRSFIGIRAHPPLADQDWLIRIKLMDMIQGPAVAAINIGTDKIHILAGFICWLFGFSIQAISRKRVQPGRVQFAGVSNHVFRPTLA